MRDHLILYLFIDSISFIKRCVRWNIRFVCPSWSIYTYCIDYPYDNYFERHLNIILLSGLRETDNVNTNHFLNNAEKLNIPVLCFIQALHCTNALVAWIALFQPVYNCVRLSFEMSLIKV